MDQFELTMARMKNLQDEFMPCPEWARAEKAECCFSLQEIWQTGRKTSVISAIRKYINKTKSTME